MDEGLVAAHAEVGRTEEDANREKTRRRLVLSSMPGKASFVIELALFFSAFCDDIGRSNRAACCPPCWF